MLLAEGCLWLAWSLWYAMCSYRKDSLTPTVANEASFRLWTSGSASGVALVAGTMCVLALFLWVAMVACVAHLWSIPDETGEKLQDGPRWFVPSFVVGEYTYSLSVVRVIVIKCVCMYICVC
jgi:hypothetical protein